MIIAPTPRLWTPVRERIVTPARCPRCFRRIVPLPKRVPTRWPTRRLAPLGMADGDSVLDASGNEIIDDSGNQKISGTSASGCCCTTTCSSCASGDSSLYIVTFSGVSLCTGCTSTGLGTCWINLTTTTWGGTYCLQRSADEPCRWDGIEDPLTSISGSVCAGGAGCVGSGGGHLTISLHKSGLGAVLNASLTLGSAGLVTLFNTTGANTCFPSSWTNGLAGPCAFNEGVGGNTFGLGGSAALTATSSC